MFGSYGAVIHLMILLLQIFSSSGAMISPLKVSLFSKDTSTIFNKVLNVEVSDTTEDDSTNAAKHIIINFILKN